MALLLNVVIRILPCICPLLHEKGDMIWEVVPDSRDVVPKIHVINEAVGLVTGRSTHLTTAGDAFDALPSCSVGSLL